MIKEFKLTVAALALVVLTSACVTLEDVDSRPAEATAFNIMDAPGLAFGYLKTATTSAVHSVVDFVGSPRPQVPRFVPATANATYLDGSRPAEPGHRLTQHAGGKSSLN